MMVIQSVVGVFDGEKYITVNVQMIFVTAENVVPVWLLSNG